MALVLSDILTVVNTVLTTLIILGGLILFAIRALINEKTRGIERKVAVLEGRLMEARMINQISPEIAEWVTKSEKDKTRTEFKHGRTNY